MKKKCQIKDLNIKRKSIEYTFNSTLIKKIMDLSRDEFYRNIIYLIK